MKIISFSDLHLEFGGANILQLETEGDVLVLPGDILTFKDYKRFDQLLLVLRQWQKPILYITGNHEYYNGEPMEPEEERFKEWLGKEYPQVTFLRNEAVTIDGVHFFGGTMWTDCTGTDHAALVNASNDFKLIKKSDGKLLTPDDTTALHAVFVEKLTSWFREGKAGPHVVISHHAPVSNPRDPQEDKTLSPLFNSLDMRGIIEIYQPDLWIYGHTHVSDDQMIGRTRIISNPLGYPVQKGIGFRNKSFNYAGLPVEISPAP